MKLQAKPINQPSIEELSFRKAARELGERIRNSPEFRSYLLALERVKQDQEHQRLSAQAQALQRASQWGFHTSTHSLQELQELEQEIEKLAVVQAYQQVEDEICHFLKAVDEIIGQEMGLPFAENAQRSGCSCSG